MGLRGPKARDPIDRFVEKFEIAESGCYLWTDTIKGSHGYGKLVVGGKFLRAHVASWLFFVGSTNGLDVCHICDIPACVNPDHLFLATHKENMLDKLAKGRGNNPTGENHFKHKLTNIDIVKIRELYPEYTMTELSKMFNLDRAGIHRIIRREIWKHI